MNMHEDQCQQRWEEIPLPIRNIARDNAAIYHITQRYVKGDIITLQEAICQMVIHLNTDWTKVKQDYLDMMILSRQPIHKSNKS